MQRAVAVWLGAIAAVVAAQQVCLLVFPGWSTSPAGGYVVAYAMVTGAVVAVAGLAPSPPPRAAALVLLPVAVVVAVGVASPEASSPGAAGVVAACLLAGGTLLGGVIGGRIEHPGHLLVVAYVTAVVDAYSVLSPGGVSAQVVDSAPLLSVLTVGWAMPGVEGVAPVLGVGDVVMSAIYLSAARAHRLGVARFGIFLLGGYALTLGALLAFERALPALPFLGLAVVAADARVRRLRSDDRRAAYGGMAAITAVLVALLLGQG